MSEFSEALIECETDLQTQLPSTFTVERTGGTFACLIDTKSAKEALSIGGMRGEEAMTLSFLRSVAYTPESGDEIEVNDETWVVDSFRRGPVKWELSLISKHE